MTTLSTFQIGGPAEYFFEPESIDELIEIKKLSVKNEIPLFILGGGSNILVSEKGINGIVCSTKKINAISRKEESILADAGAIVSNVSNAALNFGLKGFEFIYAMPGTLGGAVWMNARCYGGEISQIIGSVQYLDEKGEMKNLSYDPDQWSYKVSPFQSKDWIITRAEFKLEKITDDREKQSLQKTMDDHENDRRSKGHFDFPCAGSLFKNNRSFSAPSGKIIDSLNLRGFSLGDAQISEKHGNIFMNRNKATASDMKALISLVKNKVKKAYGYELEEEVLSIGDWT